MNYFARRCPTRSFPLGSPACIHRQARPRTLTPTPRILRRSSSTACFGAALTSSDPPTLRAAWQRVVSRKWKRIIPRMEVQFGKTHQIRGLKKTEAGYQTFNWSGGILQGPSGSFTSAVGTWVIPTVGAPSEPLGYDGRWDSSSWVGIDGWQTTNDVLQAGMPADRRRARQGLLRRVVPVVCKRGYWT